MLFVLDIDECSASEQLCNLNADCVNIHGSFYCSCFSGFTGNGFNCQGKEKFMHSILFRLVYFLLSKSLLNILSIKPLYSQVDSARFCLCLGRASSIVGNEFSFRF